MKSTAAARIPLPAGVWAMGFVSLLMDMSSEMIHSLLPLLLVGSLGASVLMVGLIEGLAEALALVSRVFSGVWSDRLGRRKPLAVFGYAMGAASKPLFALAGGIGLVTAARLADRLGKGIRGAPRDALMTDLTPPGQRGAAFGLRQSLDTVGAFIGPLIATALLLLAFDLRTVFWVATIPALLAVVVLVLAVHEAPRARPAMPVNPLRRAELAKLDAAYWRVVALGAVFTLARFSEAFLVLRAQQLGVGLAWVPMVMVLMSLVYAASAYPFGWLGDRIDRRWLLGGGLLLLIAADVALAAADGWALLGLGLVLWGLHMGATQGVLAAMVADAAPDGLRGTAFGFFNLASGVAMLAASLVAGLLWQTLGSRATFVAGAGFALVSLTLLLIGAVRRR